MTAANLRITRFHKIVWIGLVTIGLLVLLLAATSQQLRSLESSVTEIGLGDYQFVGRIDQNGTEFASYGYLYDVEGVAPYDLFSDPLNASEKTAYLTYYATATLSSRAVVTDAVRAIFALDSVGTITYYYQATPSASFDDPQSFANGTSVTAASMHFQDILNVQGPNHGLAVGNGELNILTAEPFDLGGKNVRFTRPGRAYQISTFGDALRTDPITPKSSVLLAGNAANAGPGQTYIPYMQQSGAGD